MREINLTSKQIKVLTQRHKVCREQKECDRIKAILLRNKDWSLAKIAEALLIHEKSIKRYIDDYIDNGKLKPESGGSNSYLSDEQTQLLIQHLCDVTYLHQHQIIAYIQKTFGIKYSVPGINKWLHQNRFSYKKPKGVPHKFDEIKQADFIEYYKKLLANSNADATPKTKPKRKPLPQALPRKEVVVDIDESDKVCDCCQSPLHKMGESSSEALEFVPAHIKVIKTIRPKYTCRQCERNGTESVVKTALMPATPIPKSIATPSLLSQIISCKYQFGLPLNRQETMFSDIGLELSRQTMSSWMLRSAQLLEPLYMHLKEILLAKPAIHADETPLKVIKADKSTSYMWVYCCGSDRPSEKANIILYDYHNSRAGQCAIDFLDGYQGYMHVDGYKAYGLTEAKLVACLAHIRRKFVDAKKIHAKAKTGKVDVVLNLIGKLYGIEQRIKGKSSEDKFNIRQSHAKPIVKELHHWLIKHKDKIPALP